MSAPAADDAHQFPPVSAHQDDSANHQIEYDEDDEDDVDFNLGGGSGSAAGGGSTGIVPASNGAVTQEEPSFTRGSTKNPSAKEDG